MYLQIKKKLQKQTKYWLLLLILLTTILQNVVEKHISQQYSQNSEDINYSYKQYERQISFELDKNFFHNNLTRNNNNITERNNTQYRYKFYHRLQIKEYQHICIMSSLIYVIKPQTRKIYLQSSIHPKPIYC